MDVTATRRSGSFLGLALGDILGAPLEGLTPESIQSRFGRVEELLDPMEVFAEAPRYARLKGLHTDDTQQAWILAEVLLAEGEVLPGAIAERYREFARPRSGLPEGIHRGIGPGFREVLARLERKVPPMKAGVPSAGNGAAMRIAPVGILAAGDVTLAVRQAVVASGMTHTDPRGIEAAAALAGLIAALTGRDPPEDPGDGIEAAREGAAKAEEELKARTLFRADLHREKYIGEIRRGLGEIIPHLRTDTEELLRQLSAIATSMEPDRPITLPTVAFAPASVLTAIALAVRAEDPVETMITILNLGGDTDTTAAMAGAVLGARFGRDAWPEPWLAALVAREALEAVADSLAGTATTSPPDQEPLEEEWTQLERETLFERLGL